MSQRLSTPDPARFPDPHIWATWIRHREPQFKTHSTLGQCKNAISGKSRNDTILCDSYVYKWDDDDACWVQVFFLAKDSRKQDNDLYRTQVRRGGGVRAPSTKAVNAAIESILNG